MLAVVVDGVLGPEAAHQRQRLVEDLRPLATLDPERLLLAGVGDPQPEGRQQPAAGQPVEARELLRHQHRVAAGEHHHAHPELQLRRAAGGERQRDDGVGRRPRDALAHPQRVEPEPLEVVDERAERVVPVRVGPCPQPHPDADLHRGDGIGHRTVPTRPAGRAHEWGVACGTMAAAISTHGLTKRFGPVTALDSLDLEVPEGEVFGFLGPNGAGKSTTLRLLLGSDPTVRRVGADHGHRRRRRAAGAPPLAYVPGDVSLWPRLTGEECLELFARLRGGVDEAHRDELIERF